jgi:hypothetical protein
MKFASSGGPHQVMEKLKTNLPSITQNCQELRNKYMRGQFGEQQLLPDLFSLYIAYVELVKTYQKIVEYYDDSQAKGPTIEEVD